MDLVIAMTEQSRGAGVHEYLSDRSVAQEASNDGSGLRLSIRSLRSQAVCSLEFQWWVKRYAGEGWEHLLEEGLNVRPISASREMKKRTLSLRLLSSKSISLLQRKKFLLSIRHYSNGPLWL
ncbi:hypothetical protein NDU88_003170 [Pleurodeles waltl]|uniref:Uncharacterized protein n=1 Tax=Pleurodeles waltl TaxID=8319 RepID=A0AAV7T411_PLEWA|nr:hypothetical protein NDU88_003170 [Pleurodeles waltl]